MNVLFVGFHRQFRKRGTQFGPTAEGFSSRRQASIKFRPIFPCCTRYVPPPAWRERSISRSQPEKGFSCDLLKKSSWYY